MHNRPEEEGTMKCSGHTLPVGNRDHPLKEAIKDNTPLSANAAISRLGLTCLNSVERRPLCNFAISSAVRGSCSVCVLVPPLPPLCVCRLRRSVKRRERRQFISVGLSNSLQCRTWARAQTQPGRRRKGSARSIIGCDCIWMLVDSHADWLYGINTGRGTP